MEQAKNPAPASSGSTDETHGNSNVNSFNNFFDNNYRLLVKVALAIGASFDQAEDAVNDVLTDIYRSWDQISEPRAYARKSVVNRVIKTKQREREFIKRAVAGYQATGPAYEDGSLTEWEDWQWVRQHLSTLPSAQREVIAGILDGLSASDIAGATGKTEATVRKNLQLARQRLRQELEHQSSRRDLRNNAPMAGKETQ